MADTPDDPPASTAPARPWTIDVAGTVAREAWDFNGSVEWVSGGIGGIQRHVWRALQFRSEVMLLRIAQQGDDAWLRGFTLGTRAAWGGGSWRPVIDAAVGLSDSTHETPPGGTQLNYLALIGAGVERSVGRWALTVTGRWWHASNNGREGRARNPDIQALGVVFGVGWEY